MHEVYQNRRRYLPLESFRVPGVDPLGAKVVRTFLSSGTTSSARSQSRFSAEGLAAYRAGSLTTFLAMLKKEAKGLDEIAQGLSLIPTVEAWPDSSLAQMVEWISDVMPVQFVNQVTLADALDEVGDKPVFVFGTAFHFVHLLDSGFTKKLPPGSLIIETGGTKGKSRAIGRQELYAELARRFAIAEDRIISEYGMCELASQAYGRATLKFPCWVKVSVLTGPGKVEATGRGALIVDDSQRLDVSLPIRTEDLVELHEDGTFTLLGRLESAPLKGCSLKAEEISGSSRGEVTSERGSSAARLTKTGDTDRAQAFLNFFDELLANPLAHLALAREFGSEAAATAALEDLAVSAPSTTEEWLDAAKPRESPDHWLLILPENHSLVGIYPLALGYVLGLAMTVRLPRRFAAKTSFLQIFLDGLIGLPDARVGTVSSSFRIGESAVEAGGVLCYGSDDTVANLKTLLPTHAVQGFGNQVGYTVFAASDLPQALAPLVKDALGLAQRGCMSTRFAIIIDDDGLDETQLTAALAAESALFWDATLDWRLHVGMDGAAIDLEAAGFSVPVLPEDATLLVATRVLNSVSELTPALLDSTASRHPFVLPVLILRDRVSTQFVKTALASLSLTKSDYGGLSFREVGEANRPLWDGSHETLPLFS